LRIILTCTSDKTVKQIRALAMVGDGVVVVGDGVVVVGDGGVVVAGDGGVVVPSLTPSRCSV
jgi:hypothetical protein